MITINCPKCGKEVLIDIKNALDEHGEVYKCSNCKSKFRFADR